MSEACDLLAKGDRDIRGMNFEIFIHCSSDKIQDAVKHTFAFLPNKILRFALVVGHIFSASTAVAELGSCDQCQQLPPASPIDDHTWLLIGMAKAAELGDPVVASLTVGGLALGFPVAVRASKRHSSSVSRSAALWVKPPEHRRPV